MVNEAHAGVTPFPITQPPRASEQDGTYPRPQLVRERWAGLDGEWTFRHDDENAGEAQGWAAAVPAGSTITVPFPPESPASGIGETGFHPVAWYERPITRDDLRAAGLSDTNSRLLLHFGAVDYRASVWIDGNFVGVHEGGHTPFTFDVTALMHRGDSHRLVVRAEDDPHDATQPRGKQDWHETAHAIWYDRTTGIWQTVWIEAVPAVSIDHLLWARERPDAVGLAVRLRGERFPGGRIRVELSFGGAALGSAEYDLAAGADTFRASVAIPVQRNGQAQDELTWSPEHPRLIDARVVVLSRDGAVLDTAASYFGLRTTTVQDGAFQLNDHPYNVRSVLNQGFWPESHLAAPSPAALRREVELIRELGFNACRIHQKVEDPRFLFWADRLGLLVWEEAPGAYEFSPTAVGRLVREWMAVVDRDASHPSIVTWVPFNESWGIQQVRSDPAQQAFARGLVDITRALDPTRPVISNDGWEQQNTDIITIHDYEGDGVVFGSTYADAAARPALVTGLAPSGHPQFVGDSADAGQPVMVTEFGGVNYQPGAQRADGWGYTSAADSGDWIRRVAALYDATRRSSLLAGTCYTQLTDTMQETNGMLTADRQPKAPIADIRRAVTGS